MSRDTTANSEEGSLRFYLRGKALTFYSPSDHLDFDINPADAPDDKLKLEWVYGYRGKDCRSNLFLLPTGEMIYFSAAVVVLYNVDEQTQRHYLGHTDDIKCLAVHPDKITIATGQMAGHEKREGKPHIRVWDSVSLNTLKVVGVGEFDRAVSCVAFSQTDGGRLLAAIDESNEHVLSVWEWQRGEKGHRVTETKSSTDPVTSVEFHPMEENLIVTTGKSQLSFWTLEGGTLGRKQGLFEKHEKPRFVTCAAFVSNGDVLTGDSSGNLFVWGRGTPRISQAFPSVHDGPLFSICVLSDGRILTGGGRDRRIIEWDSSYQPTGREHEIPELYGAVRMLTQGRGHMILVGTTKNCILHGALDLKFTPVVQGHQDEVWGLTTLPSQQQALTCGLDRLLILWDSMSHSAVWTKELAEGAQCVAVHPGSGVCAVGSIGPKWYVVDLNTRDMIMSHSDGSETIQCLQYSPDGSMLALGSRDNHIYVYMVTENGHKYTRLGRCQGHSSFITHLDWSRDGQYLRSNSGDYELLLWQATTCKQYTATSDLRDVQWSTQTCTLSFNTCGIWPEGADGTDVNACCAANTLSLMASADDFGKVNLYKYPCWQPKSNCLSYNGHSSHVTNVDFLNDDSRLLSVGGKDSTLLQWQFL